jgi:dsDNA-specific endonuclease/ATPase MutS2
VAKLKDQIAQEHEELTDLQHSQLTKEQELYEALDRAEAAEKENQQLAGSLQNVKSNLEVTTSACALVLVHPHPGLGARKPLMTFVRAKWRR